MKNLQRMKKAEKSLNSALLEIIIGFTFLLDSKDEIGDFLRKQASQIHKHLLEQYKKAKAYYKAFKKRHINYKQ